MKRLSVLFALLLMLLCVALVGCTMLTPPDSGDMGGGSDTPSEGGDDTPTVTPALPFEIAVSAGRYIKGGESLSLSVVDPSVLGSYGVGDVSFFAEGDNAEYAMIDNGTKSITMAQSGRYTLRARIGDVYSTNSLTVYCLASPSELSAIIESKLNSAPTLGSVVNIGLNSDTAGFYTLVGLDGYAEIRDDGMLEFVGMKGLSFTFTLKDDTGAKIYESFVRMGRLAVDNAIRAQLLEGGLIGHIDADVPAQMLPAVSALDLSGDPSSDHTKLSAVNYLDGLEYINLSFWGLGDLSYLEGKSELRTLIFDNCHSLDISDGGLKVAGVLNSLTSLETLSLKDCYRRLNRNLWDTMVSMTLNKGIELTVSEGETLTSDNVIAYSQTVFLGYEEYRAHVLLHDGYIVPAEGQSHAVVAWMTGEEPRLIIRADNISHLMLYGAEYTYYRTPVYSNSALTVDLYNYSIEGDPAGSAISVCNINGANDDLTVRAMEGYCFIYGGSYTYYVSVQTGAAIPDNPPGDGIYCRRCELYAAENAYLTVQGSMGYFGLNGSPAKDSQSRIKNGEQGGRGSYAVLCTVLNIRSERITLQGGAGGLGGNGGDGHDKDIFEGGYNGGDGGKGGLGSGAVRCTEYHDNGFDVSVSAGAGGTGGRGGNAFALGSDGDDGGTGDRESAIVYR